MKPKKPDLHSLVYFSHICDRNKLVKGAFFVQFGDHDGIGSEVLLQHPLGVLCGKDGQVYIADSYNHKVLTG